MKIYSFSTWHERTFAFGNFINYSSSDFLARSCVFIAVVSVITLMLRRPSDGILYGDRKADMMWRVNTWGKLNVNILHFLQLMRFDFCKVSKVIESRRWGSDVDFLEYFCLLKVIKTCVKYRKSNFIV